MMAVPLGSLVGSQAVHCPLTPETVDSLQFWTPDSIRALVLAALDRKEADRYMLQIERHMSASTDSVKA